LAVLAELFEVESSCTGKYLHRLSGHPEACTTPESYLQ
jgi:hypothetical protein